MTAKTSFLSGGQGYLLAILPGVALTAAIASASIWVQHSSGVPFLTPLAVAVLIGMAVRNLIGLPPDSRPGTRFCVRPVLRTAIVLLGFQLSIMQILGIGPAAIAVTTISVAATFVFARYAGRLLGIDAKLAELVGAGTAVCGASAVIAMNSVTRAPEEDVIYAVGSVTIFGTALMFLLPLLAWHFALTPSEYGLWTGAAIHEVAQVVVASFQGGQQAGEIGVVVKLTRVLLLAPLIVIVAAPFLRQKTTGAGARMSADVPKFPMFVLGFIAIVALNSLVAVPPDVKAPVVSATTFMLTMALAALGLETDFRKVRLKGWRPLLLGGLCAVFIAALDLALVKALL